VKELQSTTTSADCMRITKDKWTRFDPALFHLSCEILLINKYSECGNNDAVTVVYKL
jgi:hypothetical protein